jgi:carboxyl-terminal processing protease
LGRSISKEREDQILAMERSAVTLAGLRATLPDTVSKPVYRTDGGRMVLGGGGIVPDVLVMADTLTSSEQRALQELDRSAGSFVTAVFNYAVRYVQDRPNLDPGFSLSREDLGEVQADLAESGVVLTSEAFQAAERFIRFQVEREIALRAWGDVGEFQRMVSSDRAIQRALRLLEETTSTGELLELAANPDLSDWVPRTRPPEETDGEAGVAGS